jgi:hypothetical protein
MSKILLCEPHIETSNVAHGFYREGVGFGQIEAHPIGENGGRIAVVSFLDSKDLVEERVYDIDIRDGWQNARPVADIESPEVAIRLIAVGINSAISVRRASVVESYGDRLRKPRIQRALKHRLDDPKFAYS